MLEQPQKPQGLLNWLQESVTVKLMFIGLLTLLLLIPSMLVLNLIDERTRRQDEMEQDISDKWSGSQLIQGPVLVIPYKKFTKEKDANNKETIKETIENAYILPGTLNFKSTVKSKILNRGIFETVVYNTLIIVTGDFKAELAKLSITPEQLLLNKAKITFSISDLKGLKTNPVIKSNNQNLQAEPVFNEKGLFSNGLQANIDLTGAIDKTIPFDFILDLKGSQELRFLHSGKTTTVDVAGDWKTPSFDGRYLPDER
jgi:inner membrane protein